MDVTTSFQGAHAVVSPSGRHVVTTQNNKLLIRVVNTPQTYTEIGVRSTARDVTSLRWSEDDRHVAILSSSNIEIVDLDDPDYRVCLDNGSGGLGRFTSATFVGDDQLLVTWEFGRAKVWTLSSGKALDIPDMKTTSTGPNRELRPVLRATKRQRTLATMSRSGADDTLHIHFPALQTSMPPVRLCTIDAHSLSWSPDGRWLAILDTPSVIPNLHIYTPDGHHFRSFPTTSETLDSALGTKSLTWSPDSQMLALSAYNGTVTLLNTRTFTPRAVIEHTTTIHQHLLAPEVRAPIWQETLSSSRTRSYVLTQQPISPPVSRSKPSLEPSEIGVAEACFSCDGGFLATRDESMLSTVWLWNTSSLSTHAIMIQHSNVRRMQWHPIRPELLMLDCGEGIAYLFDASIQEPPHQFTITVTGNPLISWVSNAAESSMTIFAKTKGSFLLAYPEGIPHDLQEEGMQVEDGPSDAEATEDSIFDVLSGRKTLPPKIETSYTQQIYLDVEAEEEGSAIVEDTFHDKRAARTMLERDPLDDSEIF